MSMYKQFKTDTSLEKTGIVVDYGDFRVTLARAGGANKKFAKVLEAKSKPFRRAIQMETMDPERAEDILREVYSETVILNWETKGSDGKFKQGIEAPEGDKLLPFNPANVAKTLKALPDLFTDLQTQASSAALYREEVREESLGN